MIEARHTCGQKISKRNWRMGFSALKRYLDMKQRREPLWLRALDGDPGADVLGDVSSIALRGAKSLTKHLGHASDSLVHAGASLLLLGQSRKHVTLEKRTCLQDTRSSPSSTPRRSWTSRCMKGSGHHGGFWAKGSDFTWLLTSTTREQGGIEVRTPKSTMLSCAT